MCGRFANHLIELHEWAGLLKNWPAGVDTGYNIAPSATIPVLSPDGLQAMRWSLIPQWSNEISSKYATFNARFESVADKPAFRHAWSHNQRCLIPSLGYYEWRQEADAKQPYFIRRDDGRPLMMAGLYEPARDGIPASCTILTERAWPRMAHLHPRKPLFVEFSDAGDWLTLDHTELGVRLRDAPRGLIRFCPVSTRVNNPRNDDASLMRCIEEGV